MDSQTLQFHIELARAYAAGKHEPEHPVVAASYAAFRAAVLLQYDKVLSLVTVIHTADDPYERPSEMFRDIENGKMRVFMGGELPPDHPMSKPINSRLTLNDAFRAVHDYLGHYGGRGIERISFSPEGKALWDEERVFRRHWWSFPAEARLALVNETRAQTAYNNLLAPFGDFGEQKCVRLPHYFVEGGR